MKKNCYLIFSVLVFYLTSCISQENPPKISTPEKSNYSTVTVVDGIDIPWGMDFITENDLLVTEKKGVLYRVINGEKNEVAGLP